MPSFRGSFPVQGSDVSSLSRVGRCVPLAPCGKIFLTQGSNQGLPHCGQVLYHLSHQGSSPQFFHQVWSKTSFIKALCVCVSYSVMSDSLWPHGLWPTRLLCPWNSPGKNTGEGSQAFFRGSPQPRDWTCIGGWILNCLSYQGSLQKMGSFPVFLNPPQCSVLF